MAAVAATTILIGRPGRRRLVKPDRGAGDQVHQGRRRRKFCPLSSPTSGIGKRSMSRTSASCAVIALVSDEATGADTPLGCALRPEDKPYGCALTGSQGTGKSC
jgi:hypothetical protein